MSERERVRERGGQERETRKLHMYQATEVRIDIIYITLIGNVPGTFQELYYFTPQLQAN